MVSGTVTMYDEEKGFGFIRRDDGTADIFVLKGDLDRVGVVSLTAGQRVAFTTIETERTFEVKIQSLLPL